jgi:hypothetical protein
VFNETSVMAIWVPMVHMFHNYYLLPDLKENDCFAALRVYVDRGIY